MRYLAVFAALALTACGPDAVSPEAGSDRAAAEAGARDLSFLPDGAADWVTAEDSFVESSGLTWRVRTSGNPDGPVMVLIHGFTSSLETWDGWADALGEDYQVIRFDLPGHGLTGPDGQERYSNDETVDLTAALLADLGVEDAIVGGNSLGGLIAWRLAQEYPALVSRLVLVSPGGFSINGVTEEPAPVPPTVEAYLLNPTLPVVQYAIGTQYGDPGKLTPEVAKRTHRMMSWPGLGEALLQRVSEFTLPDPRDDLAATGQPTLILWGQRDTTIAPSQGNDFVAAMPNATLIEYDALGHMAHEEAPDITAADVKDFLK